MKLNTVNTALEIVKKPFKSLSDDDFEFLKAILFVEKKMLLNRRERLKQVQNKKFDSTTESNKPKIPKEESS